MEKVKPLKKFGQNYLFDKNILDKIIEEITPEEDDNIIEIGPGTGSLTEKLISKVKNLTAIEIDSRVIENLKVRFPSLNIIHQDFLKVDLNEFTLNKNKLRIVGNIPYNLTSPIIFSMIENINLVNDSVLMVQYEVAKRMTAKKGTKDYGILSVLLYYFADVKLCFKVSPNVFYPKPKVYSSIVHIFFNRKFPDTVDDNIFIKIVKASFGNRRKTLKNSLSNSIFGNIDFSGSGINLSLRAEQLATEQFIELARHAQNCLQLSPNKIIE